MEFQIKHKETNDTGMFYMEDEAGIISELTYKNRDGVMMIDHTQTRESMKGNGLASKIVDHTVRYARKNEIKINPICPFVVSKFNEIKAYQDVLA